MIKIPKPERPKSALLMLRGISLGVACLSTLFAMAASHARAQNRVTMCGGEMYGFSETSPPLLGSENWNASQYMAWLRHYNDCVAGTSYFRSNLEGIQHHPADAIVAGVQKRILALANAAVAKEGAARQQQETTDRAQAAVQQQMQVQIDQQTREQAQLDEEKAKRQAVVDAENARIKKQQDDRQRELAAARDKKEQEERMAMAIREQKKDDAISLINALPDDDSAKADLQQFANSEFMSDGGFTNAVNSKKLAVTRHDILQEFITPKAAKCKSDEYRSQLVAEEADNSVKVLDIYDQKSRAIKWLDRVSLDDNSQVIEQIKQDGMCTGTMLTKDGEMPIEFGNVTRNNKFYFFMHQTGEIRPLIDPALIDQNVKPSIHRHELAGSAPRGSRQ